MRHITQEALDGALARVEAIGVPEDPAHTVRSLTEPLACLCGAPVHAGTTWIKTRPDESEHDRLEREFLAAGLPVHCGACQKVLGYPTKPGEGLALFNAHAPECPVDPRG